MESFASFSTPVNDTKTIDQEVNISAFYFKNREEHLASFPKQMEYAGRQYYFEGGALRYLVHKGQQLIQLFDVSDGQDMFRLRQTGDEWRLVSVTPCRAGE
jgi:hypothetical protein